MKTPKRIKEIIGIIENADPEKEGIVSELINYIYDLEGRINKNNTFNDGSGFINYIYDLDERINKNNTFNDGSGGVGLKSTSVGGSGGYENIDLVNSKINKELYKQEYECNFLPEKPKQIKNYENVENSMFETWRPNNDINKEMSSSVVGYIHNFKPSSKPKQSYKYSNFKTTNKKNIIDETGKTSFNITIDKVETGKEVDYDCKNIKSFIDYIKEEFRINNNEELNDFFYERYFNKTPTLFDNKNLFIDIFNFEMKDGKAIYQYFINNFYIKIKLDRKE